MYAAGRGWGEAPRLTYFRDDAIDGLAWARRMPGWPYLAALC
jgi:hypothetical protein